MAGTLCAILAAGHSRRFGAADKLLAPLNGTPLVTHAARACLEAGFKPIAIVRGDAVAKALSDLGVETLRIKGANLPQSESLKAATRHAQETGADRLLITLGDMPFVTAAHLRAVEDKGTTPSASTSNNRRSPPVCFPASVFDQLLSTKDDQGARALLQAIPDSNLVQAPPELLADIDTPEDLARLAPSSW